MIRFRKHRRTGEQTTPAPAEVRPEPAMQTSTSQIHQLLVPETIRVGLPGHTKEEVLNHLIDLLRGHPAVRDLEAVRQAVLARERMMSTGVAKAGPAPCQNTGCDDHGRRLCHHRRARRVRRHRPAAGAAAFFCWSDPRRPSRSISSCSAASRA